MMDKIVDGLLELRLLHSCLTVQSGVRRIAVSLYSKISKQRPLDVLLNIFSMAQLCYKFGIFQLSLLNGYIKITDQSDSATGYCHKFPKTHRSRLLSISCILFVDRPLKDPLVLVTLPEQTFRARFGT